MRCGIISIGDELLSGKTINSNAAYISSRLSSIGIETVEVRVVGDRYYQIQTALKGLLSMVDLVVMTGGLGPTHDDVTKKAVADFFNSRMRFYPDLFEELRERFERRGVSFPESNRDQAIYPDKAILLPNPVGTAQGMLFQNEGKRVVVLPGVPAEMKAIMEERVLAELRRSSDTYIDSFTLRTTGIAESALYDHLQDWVEQDKGASIAFLPGWEGVDIRVTVSSDSEEETNRRLIRIKGELLSKLGDYYYGEGEKRIEEIIAEELLKRGMTVAVAESCTGGFISHRLTNVPGSSGYYERGVVSYSNEAKKEILGVSQETLLKYGAVSKETALEMAAGIRKLAGTDLAISITGIAGPTGGTPDKPVGLVYIGFDSATCSCYWRRIYTRNRDRNKVLFSQAALDLLRRFLFYGIKNVVAFSEL